MGWVGLDCSDEGEAAVNAREGRRRKSITERSRLVAPRTEVMPDGGSGAWWRDDGGVLAGKSPALPEARKSRVSMRISPPKKKGASP